MPARAVEARGNHPGRGAFPEVRLQAKDRVPGRRDFAAPGPGAGVRQRPPGSERERADGDRPRLPGEPGAPLDVAFEAHPAAEEDFGLPPGPELEQSGALEEELPLFRKEKVEPGEVDLDVVRLDLGEVGVPGQIQREVGGQPVLQVQTGLRLAFEVGLAGERLAAEGGEGLHLEAVAAADVLQAGERCVLGRLGDTPHEVLADVGPEDVLVLPPDGALDGDPHHRFLHVGEADGGERDRHLEHPALGVHGGLGGEDAVPVPVGAVEAFVREERVVLGAERADLEDVAVPAVEIGVEGDDHPVVLADPAAAVEDRPVDPVGFGIEEREPEVERVVVVGDPHLGPLAGGRAVHRVALPEAGDRADLGPERFVEHAVHAGRSLDADRPRFAVLSGR